MGDSSHAWNVYCASKSQGGGTASDETAKYGALSEAGIPTVAANGEALSKVIGECGYSVFGDVSRLGSIIES